MPIVRTPVLKKKKWAESKGQIALGVDPGLMHTGVAIVARETSSAPLRVLHGSVITTKPLPKKHRRQFRKTNDRQRRHKDIWNQLCALTGQFEISAVGVEAYIVNPGQRGSIQGVQALGIYCGVLWWAWERQLYVAGFLPADLKKRFCGKQSASKEEVAKAIQHGVVGLPGILSGLKNEKLEEHVADAVGHAVLVLDEIDATKTMLGLG